MIHLLNFIRDIQHPTEGMAYLVYISLLVRWRWPQAWNRFLQRLTVAIGD